MNMNNKFPSGSYQNLSPTTLRTVQLGTIWCALRSSIRMNGTKLTRSIGLTLEGISVQIYCLYDVPYYRMHYCKVRN